MKRVIILLTALCLVLSLSSFAFADPMAYKDRYYSDPNPPRPFDPVWNGVQPDPWDWNNPPWVYGFPRSTNPGPTIPAPGFPLEPLDSLLFGMENVHLDKFAKTVTLVITYTGGSLKYVESKAGYEGGVSGVLHAATVTEETGVLTVVLPIYPQPDWEWILIVNDGGTNAVINTVTLDSSCESIPSLTEWGMVGLVVLMLAAGAMVIVRRRRATAAA